VKTKTVSDSTGLHLELTVSLHVFSALTLSCLKNTDLAVVFSSNLQRCKAKGAYTWYSASS